MRSGVRIEAMAGVDVGTKNADESNNSDLDHTAPTPYKIMTINMGGDGTAVERRNLSCRILSKNPCDIIFCQELPGFFEEKVVQEVDRLIKYDYKYVRTEKASAVIWSTKHFDGSIKGFNTTDRDILRIRENIMKDDNSASEILGRIAMVKLTVKKNKKTFLATSFHGPWKITNEKKKEIFKSLLEFLQHVIRGKKVDSYIIGGDFNFNTLDSINDLPPDVAVGAKYNLTARAESKIPYKDNFVYYPETILKVKKIQALDIGPMLKETDIPDDHEKER